MERITLLLIAVVAMWLFLSRLLPFLRRRQLRIRNGCQLPPSATRREPIFAVDFTLDIISAVKTRSFLPPLNDMIQKFGRTCAFHKFGQRRLVTIEPDNLKIIYSSNTDAFCVKPLRYWPVEPVIGAGALTEDGPAWHRSRRLVQAAFTNSDLNNLEWISPHVENMIRAIPKDGTTVDMLEWFLRLDLDISTELLFGDSFGALSSDGINADVEEFIAAWKVAQRGMGTRTLIRAFVPQYDILHYWDSSFWKACEVVKAFVDGMVARAAERKKSGTLSEAKGKHVMVDVLVTRSGDRADIRNQLMNAFLALESTTAILLANMYFNLARYPAAFDKLRREVENESPTTQSSIKRLPYLQSVLKETLRMYPPVSTVPTIRLALTDLVLPRGGSPSGNAPILVRKGDRVQTSFSAAHRQTHVYGEDVETFRPERWQSIDPGPWEFMPFNNGPRACPGRELAMAEAGYVMVKLMQAFPRLENRDPVFEFVEQTKFATESKNGVKVALWAK